jgi:hypothetical protein
MTKQEKAEAKRARRAARNEMHPGAFSAYAKANAFALPSERPARRPRVYRPPAPPASLAGLLALLAPEGRTFMPRAAAARSRENRRRGQK